MEKVANIEVVRLDNDEAVLLTNTPHELSIGLILLPGGEEAVIASLKNRSFPIPERLQIDCSRRYTKDEVVEKASDFVSDWFTADARKKPLASTLREWINPNERGSRGNAPHPDDLTEEQRRRRKLSRIQEFGIKVPMEDIKPFIPDKP